MSGPATAVLAVADDSFGHSSALPLIGLAWAAFALVLGLLLATDHRGFVDHFTAVSAARPRFLPQAPESRRNPGPARRTMIRLVGGVFAVAGAVVLVLSVVRLATTSWRLPPMRLHPRFAPIGLGFAAVMLLVTAQAWWSPDSLFRLAWARGGIARAAVVEAMAAGVVAMCGAATQVWALFVIGWVLGVPGVITMALTRHRAPDPS